MLGSGWIWGKSETEILGGANLVIEELHQRLAAREDELSKLKQLLDGKGVDTSAVTAAGDTTV